MSALWVVGDIHGAYDKLRQLLRQAGLLTADDSWQGADARLVFLGDYLDRGPHGLDVIRLIRRLEPQARAAGGQITALLGNHEVMFLAALHFRASDPGDALGFRDYWLSNGGQESDAAQVQIHDLTWLRARPALAHADGWLLAHADSLFYLRLGRSIEAVNRQVGALLGSSEAKVWSSFMNIFADRFAFTFPSGERAAHDLLSELGGARIVHGHTPVYVLLDELMLDLDTDPTLPITYAGGLCVDMDSGMAYREEAGFIARLGNAGVAETVTLHDDLGPF
ncbi:metallophosphoesterase [Deinococcus koreensis]|uniref:Metallophosphoesterase n=1 Tax=Deinococcus koreensis TaxID=2054903 RepID=A0A2K3UVM3_9DEIO|nr:metallophosphoesterase [Deinococcus koreensis]PNY80589.1 metallophosphoesterase [Deinococcus koreensis]